MNKYKKEILNQYGLSEYDLNCPECGSKLELDDYTCICHNCWYQEDISEFAFDHSENVPDCCTACGCDLYPDCMDSCKIFND